MYMILHHCRMHFRTLARRLDEMQELLNTMKGSPAIKEVNLPPARNEQEQMPPSTIQSPLRKKQKKFSKIPVIPARKMVTWSSTATYFANILQKEPSPKLLVSSLPRNQDQSQLDNPSNIETSNSLNIQLFNNLMKDFDPNEDDFAQENVEAFEKWRKEKKKKI